LVSVHAYSVWAAARVRGIAVNEPTSY